MPSFEASFIFVLRGVFRPDYASPADDVGKVVVRRQLRRLQVRHRALLLGACRAQIPAAAIDLS